MNERAHSPFAPTDVRFCGSGLRGNLLILTENLGLVLSLRQELMRDDYNITWTNNLWIALSYVQSNAYVGLIFDLQAESVEEHFAIQLLEEYRANSRGEKVILATESLSPSLKNRLQNRQCTVLEGRYSSPCILNALNLPSGNS